MTNTPLGLRFVVGFLAATAPLLGSAPAQPGVYSVITYSASGSHTDYDMARQAADAYAVANPWTGSILVLKPVSYTHLLMSLQRLSRTPRSG